MPTKRLKVAKEEVAEVKMPEYEYQTPVYGSQNDYQSTTDARLEPENKEEQLLLQNVHLGG